MNGHTNGVNGASHVRPLTAGIYAPIPTFYQPETEDLDLEAFSSQIVRLAKAGVRPLIAGSMGEGIHLTHAERKTLIQTARRTLDDAGFTEMPVIAGTGTGSTRETIELSQEAAEAGADYAIVIMSGYFAAAITRKAIKSFFLEVAAKSPLPIIIYNYPGAAGGIDIDSDTITELAIESPNTCGVKLTCGNVGKLTRICATVSEQAFVESYPRKNPAAPFLVLGGFADFILPATYANGHGAIIGLANVAPHACARLFELSEATRKDQSLLPEAQRLQGIIARGDFTIAKTGIAGTKFLLEKLYGYGGLPRKPLPPIEPDVADALWAHAHTQELIRTERELSGKTTA